MKRILLTLICITLILLSTACNNGNKENDKSQSISTQIEDVKQTVDAYGVVKCTSIKNIIIDFPVSIESVDVKEGQRVKMGKLLLTLDMDEYFSQIKSKELELQAHIRELSTIKDDIKKRENHLKNNSNPDIKKLLNDLKSFEKNYAKTMDELKTKKELFRADCISQTELEEFEKTVNDKKKNIDDTKSSLEGKIYELEQKIEELKKDANEKNAEVDILKCEIATSKNKLEKSFFKENTVISDVNNGVVFNIKCMPGDIIDYHHKVLSIMDLDSMIIDAQVSEEFIKDVNIDAVVAIIPLADKSRKYKGKVIGISNKADQNNGETNVNVEISIEDKDDFLLPDFNVDVEIENKGE